MTVHPLNPICKEWLSKIEMAAKAKEDRFGKYAKEAMRFFDGAHDWMWEDRYSKGPGGFLDKGGQLPTFRMTVNRVFEIVALFGPALYHKNPNILVTPLMPPEIGPESLGLDINDPLHAQMFAGVQQEMHVTQARKVTHANLYQHYLNWSIVEGDLKSQSRLGITEALIKGLSFNWVELYQPKGSQLRYPRAMNVSVDDVVVDPDATCWEDVQWVARRCEHPVNRVEEFYGLAPGTIKGHRQSMAAQATEKGKREAKENRNGKSFDTLEYWKVYSKNGFGQRLQQRDGHQLDKLVNLDMLGDNCLIVVAKDVPYPLNIPPERLDTLDPEDPNSPHHWPIPFWMDEGCGGGWPFARLFFYDKPGSVWPISLIKPAIGEMRFVNWCMSFLADKVASSCATYLGVLKSAAADIQKQLTEQRMGNGMTPFTILELSETLNMPIDNLVKFLQAPSFQQDIWTMVAEVNQSIDKRIGLTELLYGLSGRQIRSATEADVKDQNLNIRPDDMASRTEDWLSETALKQMEAARWLLEGEDVRGVLGDIGAHVWDSEILTQDADAIVRDFQFRVEAGSARKPNKNNKIRTLQEFGQVGLQVFSEMAAAGNVGPFNAYIKDWCKANDLDHSEYLLQPPDPNAPQPEQMEMEAKVAELEMKMAEMQAKLQFSAEEHGQEMEQDAERHRLEMAQLKQKAKVDAQVAKQKIALQKAAAKAKPKPTGAKK